MSFRSQIPFLLAVFLVAIGGTFLAIQVFGGAVPSSSTQTELVTVVVYITNTPDPNVTPNVIIITSTPDRTQVPLPAGLVPTGDGSSLVSPSNFSTQDSQSVVAPGEVVLGVPQGCILHIVDSGDTVFGLAEEYGVDPFLMLNVNGMTEDDAASLQIGDELIVPVDGCPVEQIAPPLTDTPFPTETPEVTEEPEETELPPTPAVSPTITLAPTAEDAVLEIVSVLEAGDVTAEGVRIRNPGSNSTVTVTGWTLEDLDGNVYNFRNDQRIFSNSEVTIYTRAGQDTPISLFWGLEEAVWQAGDVITLRDNNQDVQAILRVPSDSDLP